MAANGNGNGNGIPHVPKLDPEAEQRLFKAISVGCTIEVACQHAGISSSTYYRLRDAAKDAVGGKLKAWWDGLKKAEADCQVLCMTAIQGGEKGWQGKAWIMERRFGYYRTERQEQQVEHSGGVEITVKRLEVSEDDRRE